MSHPLLDSLGSSSTNALVQSLFDQQDGAGGDDATSLDIPDGTISDADLIAWLEEKSASQNDQLRDQMVISTGRSNLIEQLNDLKAIVDANGHPPNIKDQMTGILNDPKNTAYYSELAPILQPAIDKLAATDKTTIGDDSLKNLQSNVSDQLQGEIDKLGKVDSLALIQIQQVMADANQTSQLASNVLSSRSQTSTGIIGNIRA